MRKLSFLFFIAAIFASCQSTASLNPEDPAQMEKLTGLWRREGDASAGDVVKIEYSSAYKQPVGILVTVSSHSKMFGYEAGEIKWKFSRINDDGTVLIQNLNSTLTREEGSRRVISIVKNYAPFLITVIDKNLISIQNKDASDNERIGNDQKWRRISK